VGRAGIDEKRPAMFFVETLPSVMVVVQRRRILVERDDVPVRQLLLGMIDAAQIGEVDLILRLPFAKRALRGDVSTRAALVRAAQALDLILGLPRAIPVEAVDD